MFYFIWLEVFFFFKFKERLLYYLQNMCYCKNSLKIQEKLILFKEQDLHGNREKPMMN